MRRMTGLTLLLIGVVAGLLMAQVPAASAPNDGMGSMMNSGMGGMMQMMGHMGDINEMMDSEEVEKMMGLCNQMMEDHLADFDQSTSKMGDKPDAQAH